MQRYSPEKFVTIDRLSSLANVHVAANLLRISDPDQEGVKGLTCGFLAKGWRKRYLPRPLRWGSFNARSPE